jgi:hypothetical protein
MSEEEQLRVAFRRRAPVKKGRARRLSDNQRNDACSSDDADEASEGRPLRAAPSLNSAKSTRRRPRDLTERVTRAPEVLETGAESNDSDASEPGNDRAVTSVAQEEPTRPTHLWGGEANDAPRDYSAAGIARLAEQTRLAEPEVAPRKREPVERAGNAERVSRATLSGQQNSGVRLHELSQMERVLSARGGMFSRRETPSVADTAPSFDGRPSSDAAAYVPLRRQDGFLAEDVIGTAIIDPENASVWPKVATGVEGSGAIGSGDDSAGSAWEQEQLRRAGLGPSERRGVDSSAATVRARAIAEEESLMRGGRGEVGLSVTETCADNLAARVGAAKDRLSKLESELEAIIVAQSHGASEIVTVKKSAREALLRRDYYAEFLQYLTDLNDMLAVTEVDTVKCVNAEVQKLAALARVRTTEVDEFGRARRVAFDFRRDGYDSPPSFETLRSAAEYAPVYSLDGIDGNVVIDDASRADELRLSEARHPLSAVSDEFKSLPTVLSRFLEWKAQYPSDYKAAYGDLTLAKTCGALALATGLSKSTDWLDQIPPQAKCAAAIKSRAASWVALRIAATWEPQSDASTRIHALAVRKIVSCLADHPNELLAARMSFLRSALDVLLWKTNALVSSFQLSSEREREWIVRAAVKCSRSAGKLACAVGRPQQDLAELEDVVVRSLFCGLILPYVQDLMRSTSAVDDSSFRVAELLLFAVEDGCIEEPASRSGSDASVLFPSQSHAGWAPIRRALRDAIGSQETRRRELKAALARIGGSLT